MIYVYNRQTCFANKSNFYYFYKYVIKKVKSVFQILSYVLS